MKPTLFAIAIVLFALLLIPTTYSAPGQNSNSSTASATQKPKPKPKPKTITLKGAKGDTSRGGSDPNIKDDKQTNDPNAPEDAPSKKGGTSRGGGNCEVRLDNRTQWYIKIYVDGGYRGTLSPYGDAVAYTGVGSTTVYGRADFDDGTYYYWGPNNYNCGANQFIYFKMVR
jgi:hypothetical protein